MYFSIGVTINSDYFPKQQPYSIELCFFRVRYKLNFEYVVVLISLCLFPIPYFPICGTNKIIFLGWVKEVRTKKS
jgi:hypothetical protein